MPFYFRKECPLNSGYLMCSRSRLGERPKGQGITGADHFWFGHTPLRHRVDIGNLHYIDTGAVFGGELTLVQLQ
ncbi:serine/threonine-protein phosphatase, partial [Shigella flexneri]|nr:serine/threonine protein phosphatase [Shigella flexneri]